MAAISIPKEMIENAGHKKNADQPQTIEACNHEIKSAIFRAERGVLTGIEDAGRINEIVVKRKVK